MPVKPASFTDAFSSVCVRDNGNTFAPAPGGLQVLVMFTGVFQKSGDCWAAYVEEVPGVNTQGTTLEEARANLREALALVLEANREIARRDEPDDCIREPIALVL